MSDLLLRRAAVLDETGAFDGPLDVAVRGGTIEAVGRELAADGLREVDCEGLFLMPGVIDCHAHVGVGSLDMPRLLDQPITRWALEAAVNARLTLEGGVTLVRDAGGADAGIRDAIADGVAVGPRLLVSIVLICQTGGHGDGFLRGPGLELASQYILPEYPGRPPFVVDGVDMMRKVVRQCLRAGADWIKVAATGGVLSPHDDPLGAEFTREELAAAVFEAGRKGKGVLAHAFGGEGVDLAIETGIRSIEHGIFLTEEQAVRMAERGTWLVPTLAVMEDVFALARDGKLPPDLAQKALSLQAVQGQAVAIARAAGVQIALGTDAFLRPAHGRNLREIALMTKAGLTPQESLLAATRGGAELCGLGDRLGRIAPGHAFDAILLDEDPSDATLFARDGVVTGVFKAGEPAVAHPRLAG